jgi:hypothetical protein
VSAHEPVATAEESSPRTSADTSHASVWPVASATPGTTPQRLLMLQRRAGNRAVGQMLSRWSVPPVPSAGEVAKEASDAAIATFRSMGEGTEEEVKQRALSHAWEVSWAMTSKSSGEAAMRAARGAYAWATDDKSYKPARVQSTLGGAYLRMYLAGKVDPDTVSAAGVEMGASPEFAKLTAGMHTALAGLKPSTDTATAQEQIQDAAQAYLDRLMKDRGLAFRYELNAVIGGVGGVAVTRVDLFPLPTAEGMQRFYVLHLSFRDAYDFENTRSGVYDVYRKKLAKLLADGRYQDFWEAYGRETIGLGYTGLDSAAIFAAFMYALEKAGWTPGRLPWEVTVPLTGTIP